MKKNKRKINPILNKMEIGRRLNVSGAYIGQLLDPKNKKKNPARLEQIKNLLTAELSSISFR